MFVNMGFVTPRPGKEKVMAQTMRSFADALEEMPGLLAVFVLSEEGGQVAGGCIHVEQQEGLRRGHGEGAATAAP